jgi:hypothetical protein
MPNIKDYKVEDPTIQAVIMGPPGVGKTWVGCTFPEVIVVFDFDGKIGVARNPDFVKKYGIRNIEYKTLSENKRMKGIASAHNAYDDACRFFDDWMQPGLRDRVGTFIVDSGTSLMDASRNKALIILGGLSDKGNKTQTFDTAMKTGFVAMQGKDHGGERSLTEQFLRMVKDTGKNVLVNVHQYERYDDNGNLVEVTPLFTGQSRQIIPAMFKDIWHLKVQGAGSSLKRVLTAEYNGIYQARSELGIGIVENPDYDSIIARIRSRQSEALAATKQPDVPLGTTVPAKVTA